MRRKKQRSEPVKLVVAPTIETSGESGFEIAI
jgi:hypothetical protein